MSWIAHLEGSPSERRIHLLLMHRHQVFCDSLRRHLSADERFESFAATGDLDRAHARLRRSPIDLILIDSSFEYRAALSATERFKEEFPTVRLLPIGLGNSSVVVDFIEAGADGYLLRETSLDEMTAAILAVHRGEPPCSTRVANQICRRLRLLKESIPSRATETSPLTPRETEVLELIAQGLANKDIARQLRISPATVKNHVHNLLDKLEASGRREAIHRGIEAGILEGALRWGTVG